MTMTLSVGRGDLLTSVLKEEHGALLTLRIMRGSIATQKKITRIKVFINFNCFYAFDSSENLRCVGLPTVFCCSLAIMGRILGNIYFSTNQKPANKSVFSCVRGDKQTFASAIFVGKLFCENYTHVTLVSQIVLQVGLNKRKFIY
jgi:hypothetical protein